MTPVSKLWSEMGTKLQIIHENILKIQCSNSFVDCGEINDYLKENMPGKSDEIKEVYSTLMRKASQFSEKAINLAQRPEMDDFDFVDEYFNQFTDQSENVHQVIGSAISNYIGHTMISEILKKTKLGPGDKDSELKYDKSIVPESIFKQIFTFSSLICRPKDEVEKYDTQKLPSKSKFGSLESSAGDKYTMKQIYSIRETYEEECKTGCKCPNCDKSVVIPNTITSVIYKNKSEWKVKKPRNGKMSLSDVSGHLEYEESD